MFNIRAEGANFFGPYMWVYMSPNSATAIPGPLTFNVDFRNFFVNFCEYFQIKIAPTSETRLRRYFMWFLVFSEILIWNWEIHISKDQNSDLAEFKSQSHQIQPSENLFHRSHKSWFPDDRKGFSESYNTWNSQIVESGSLKFELS